MKTVRFSKVVETAGKPEPYLLLSDPADDRHLQAAIKAGRMMTVFQTAVGSKADSGEVGFKAGRAREFLIFPKSLKRFDGTKVVGIKYDQLSTPELSKSERAEVKQPPKRTKKEKPKATKKAARNVIKFEPPEDEDETEANEDVAAIKKKVRHAMEVLESGKQVAAYRLLKKIVEG